MLRLIYTLGFLVVCLNVNAGSVVYSFSGTIDYSNWSVDVDDSNVFLGETFSGVIAIETSPISPSSAYLSSRRYHGLVTELSVSIDVDDSSYEYSPYLESVESSWAGTYSALWAEDYEGFEFRQHNYPSVGDDGEWGPSGPIPDSYYVNGFYPHSFFFTARSRSAGDLLSLSDVETANFDLMELYNVTGIGMTLRYTDPTIEGWETREQLRGVVSGNVNSLTLVPEPAASGLVTVVGLMIAACGVRRSRLLTSGSMVGDSTAV